MTDPTALINPALIPPGLPLRVVIPLPWYGVGPEAASPIPVSTEIGVINDNQSGVRWWEWGTGLVPVDRRYRCVSVEAVEPPVPYTYTPDMPVFAEVWKKPHRILSTDPLREPVSELGIMAVTTLERVEG